MSTYNDEPPSDSAAPAAWCTWAKLAADDEDWVNALVRWECCIEKFGPGRSGARKKQHAFYDLMRLPKPSASTLHWRALFLIGLSD